MTDTKEFAPEISPVEAHPEIFAEITARVVHRAAHLGATSVVTGYGSVDVSVLASEFETALAETAGDLARLADLVHGAARTQMALTKKLGREPTLREIRREQKKQERRGHSHRVLPADSVSVIYELCPSCSPQSLLDRHYLENSQPCEHSEE